jgi:hypothetical protein
MSENICCERADDEIFQRLDRIEAALRNLVTNRDVEAALADVVRGADIAGMMSKMGWAEVIATPNEDVGFVFTWLASRDTGLPVDISVGDDTPLVIACPRDLDAETVAAVRHWVVRNRDALADHWQNRISSAELIKRLKS